MPNLSIRVLKSILLILLFSASSTVFSAPLDELHIAMKGYPALHGEFEFALDKMNDTLDLLNLRGRDKKYAGTDVGDYDGMHVLGGLALSRRLWIDGGYWQRSVQTSFDVADTTTWHMGAQFQLTVNMDWLPALAIRISRWGNYTPEVIKNSKTRFQGIDFDRIEVNYVEDNQTQIDLIGTWSFEKTASFSFFGGVGSSEVTYQDLVVNLQDVCQYSVNYWSGYNKYAGYIEGIQARGLPGNGGTCLINEITVPAKKGQYIPKGLGVAYNARYIQFGGSFQWFDPNWRVRFGYRYHLSERESVEEVVSQLGKTTYQSNHLLTADFGFKPFEHVGFFMRGQIMSNQFLGEIPFSYNAFSANQFGKLYGLASFGIIAGF
ncbi:MAG: hypothetical protein HQL54_01395 [Magnetococcales bacterium]|nr:hypothetical protein [Magnetococcales bacterium]